MKYFSLSSLLGPAVWQASPPTCQCCTEGWAVLMMPMPQCFGASCKGAGSFPASKLCKLTPMCSWGHRLPALWPSTCI